MLLQSKFTTKYNENQICLIDYLKNQMKPGSNFFKSKYIAKDTGLPQKRLGPIWPYCPRFVRSLKLSGIVIRTVPPGW